MRDIKFRAWEKTLKEMIPVNSINFESKIMNMESAWRFLDEIILLLYTGRKDKHGREIYQGDVIDEETPDGTFRYVVKWNDEEACFLFDYCGDCFMAKNMDFSICDVVGNIFESPELLEGR